MEKYQLSAAKTGSDSEVLLQLFRHKGPEFVKELNAFLDSSASVMTARMYWQLVITAA